MLVSIFIYLFCIIVKQFILSLASLILYLKIAFYCSVDERIQAHRIARVVVHADGSILWVPQALFKSACQVEITYFPYDTQASFYLLLKGLVHLLNIF